MINDFSNLKSPFDWGKYQFHSGLLCVYSWILLGEQHFLTSKVLLKECWNAKNELYTKFNEITEFAFGTKEFEVLQKTYLYEPATFFLALSFENLLKGIWLKQNLSSMTDKNRIPEIFKDP